MKKLTKGKKVVLWIVAFILLIVVGTCTYFLAEHYVFYPRTIQDVINKYEKMDAEKAFDVYHYHILPDGTISYSNGGGMTYKDSVVVRNSVWIYYTEAMSEEYLNDVAKKYNAEITQFVFDPITRKSDFLGLELKKNHSEKELNKLINEIEEDDMYVDSAGYEIGYDSSWYGGV